MIHEYNSFQIYLFYALIYVNWRLFCDMAITIKGYLFSTFLLFTFQSVISLASKERH